MSKIDEIANIRLTEVEANSACLMAVKDKQIQALVTYVKELEGKIAELTEDKKDD